MFKIELNCVILFWMNSVNFGSTVSSAFKDATPCLKAIAWFFAYFLLLIYTNIVRLKSFFGRSANLRNYLLLYRTCPIWKNLSQLHSPVEEGYFTYGEEYQWNMTQKGGKIIPFESVYCVRWVNGSSFTKTMS